MGGIFICYRRDDTAGWAGRLHADLQAGLEGVTVFRDIDAIPPGVKFDEYIAQAVGSCDVLIALIGPHWLTAADKHGVRRLDDPHDFIRLEIATCLQRDIRVIPALVANAKVPAEEDLPEDIRALARRQAYELSDSRWAADCKKLIADLAPLVRPRTVSRRGLIAAGIALAVLAAGGYALWPRNDAGPDGPAGAAGTAGPSGTVPEPVTVTTPAGGAAPASTGTVAGGASLIETPIGGSPRNPPATPTPAAPVTYVSNGAAGAGVFEFAWPGGDCWDIYRGTEKITYGCGDGKQALAPGRYTIKNGAGLFVPFEVDVRAGFVAHVTKGGVVEVKWPGGDCWDIYRGEEKVTYGCGTGKQALQQGRYSIRNANALFLPFNVDVKDGVTTTAQLGGVFEFKWPGGDCWDIHRGAEKITYGCGTGKQALQQGRYSIRNANALFLPFDIEIKAGVTTTTQLGGVFEFKWPGGDCWDIYRGEEKITYGCGTGKQALQAGRYTVKPSSAAVFRPFEITVKDGATVKAP